MAPAPPISDSLLPRRSLRSRFLLPFGVGVALLCVTIGAVTGLGTRKAAEAELLNRARTAERVFHDAMLRQQARLEREATLQAADRRVVAAVQRRTSRDLARLGFPNALSNRFDYVAVHGPRGEHVYSKRGADWSVLSDGASLLGQVEQGIAEGGVAVARDGTPVLFAAVPVRIAAPTYGAIVVGEPVKAVNLEEVSDPLEVTLELRTSRGGRVNSLGGAQDERARVRAYAYPVRVSRFSAGDSQVVVGLSTAPLARATNSAALTAAMVALGLALALMLLGGLLLDRAVLRPLAALLNAIRQVKAGTYDITLPLGRSRELAELADGFSRMAAIVGEHQGRLEEQARRDSLTGLANHACFHDAFKRAVATAERESLPFAVVALDIDHFKEINDEHGHPHGDRVLQAIGKRLQTLIRAEETAGRLGGDEFALLLCGVEAEQAAAVAERVRAATSEIRVGGVRVSTSVGVASFPADTPTPAVVLDLADRALYGAKRGGRGRVHRHETPGAPLVREDSAEVRGVLNRPDGICAVFQPVVSLQTGQLVGYEALARFAHPSGRPPDVWFAQAHRCGLGPELEARALAKALLAARRPPGTFLALNVSPSALSAAPVRDVLPDDLSDVVLEITEQELITDVDTLTDSLSAVRQRGARIALDDAGAGYAGLQQVMRLQPDLIKLDRSLVRGLHADRARSALIEAFVSFAARTGAEICAEGIESVEELIALAQLGVNLGQGYLLARPAAPWTAPSETALAALGATPRPQLPSLSAVAG